MTRDQQAFDNKNDSRQSIRSSWILYATLVLFRLAVAPNCFGYIHPDEFFQGGQELWYGCSFGVVAWEFEPQHALRSVVPPTVMTKVPLAIYSKTLLLSGRFLSAREVLIVPRLFCAIMTILLLDGVVWKLTSAMDTRKQRKQGGIFSTSVPTSVLVLASSWPTLAMLTKPFTNTLETLFISILMYLVLVRNKAGGTFSVALVVGMTCAFGIFTRFTFVCFALPLILEYVGHQLKSTESRHRNSSMTSHDRTTMAKIRDVVETARQILLRTVLPMGIGFCATSTLLISADYTFYSQLENAITDSWTAYITPLNAFLYNSQVDNLRHHGLHPQWTHPVVNMHILFGPLTIISYLTLTMMLVQPWTRIKLSSNASREQKASRRITRVSGWILLSGLILLSSAPHQEPRFLLPLIVPVIVLTHDAFSSSKLLVIVSVLFNSILFGLFGVLHQGGVIPSLMHDLETSSSSPKALIYFHTYMPPAFLTRQGQNLQHVSSAETACLSEDESDGTCLQRSPEQQQVCPEYPIVDLQGADFDALSMSLNQQLDCSSTARELEFVYLVSPPLEAENGSISPRNKDCVTIGDQSSRQFDCMTVRTFQWHLTTEDIPPFRGSLVDWIRDLNLSIYKVSCGEA